MNDPTPQTKTKTETKAKAKVKTNHPPTHLTKKILTTDSTWTLGPEFPSKVESKGWSTLKSPRGVWIEFVNSESR